MRSVVWLLIGFLSMSGCGPIKEQMYQSEFDRVIKEKALAVESSKELDPIRQKVWMGALKDEPPLSMFMLSEKATEAEKPAIEKWHEILLNYKGRLVALTQEYYPMDTGRLETQYGNRLSLVVELYSQNISYGDYNKRTKDVYLKSVQEASDMQQRQSFIQQMRPPDPPSSFSCYTAGNQIFCR